MMKLLYVLAPLLLLAAMDLCSVEARQKNETLKGVVKDSESGLPVAGAAVQIEELNQGAATNTAGEFEFPGISPGNYTLRVQSVGYATATVQVAHPGDRDLTIELDVTVFTIDEVIVTISPLGRYTQYQSARAFNRQDLQQQMAPSLGEILDGSPGISMRSFGSAPARPVIRGLDGERVLILQNGERMGDFSAKAADHTVALDPLAIERVEIVRGPASLLYGSSALGGVVNLFTRDQPQEWTSGMSGDVVGHGASVNNLGSGKIRGQYGTESWALSGRGMFHEGGNVRTPEGVLPSTWMTSRSLGSGFGYRSGNLQTGLAVTMLSKDFGVPEELDDPDESRESRNKRYSLQSVSQLEFDNGFFESAELRLHANYNELEDIEIEIEPEGELEVDVEKRLEQRSLSSTLTLRHRPLSGFEGVTGINVEYRDLKISGDEILAPNAQNFTLAGFIFEEMDLANSISLQAGTRLEFQQMNLRENQIFNAANIAAMGDRSNLILSGAAGLNVELAAGWQTGIQLAHAFRTPSLEELYSNAPHFHAGAFEIGDPDLENEVSLGSDLFVNYSGRRIRLQLSGYVKRVENFIMYTPTGEIHAPSGLPVFTYTATEALLYGFEFELEGRIARHFHGGFSMDHVIGSQRDADRTPLSFMPPIRTTFSLKYDNNTWWAGAVARAVSEQTRVTPLEEPTDGYTLVGLDAGYRLGQEMTFSLRIDNILNVSYRDHLTRVEERDNPMPGRNLNASLRWEF